jgi:rubrerythrin
MEKPKKEIVMVTLVGTQNQFSDAIKALIELDFDAADAYEAAIDKIDTVEYKKKLEGFRQDHLKHTQALSQLLRDHNEEPPVGPDHTKHYIAEGKVTIAGLIGEKTVLKALNSNEVDTNTAYDRINERTDIWEEAKPIIKKGREDEHRHKQWLDSVA